METKQPKRTISIKRKSNLMLAAREFKILFDGLKYDGISNGEFKKIEIPVATEEFTVKVQRNESEPIRVEDISSDEIYVIKQNMYSTLATFAMILLIIPYFILKIKTGERNGMLLMIALPFLLVNVYFLTFGKRKVIQVVKSEQNNKNEN